MRNIVDYCNLKKLEFHLRDQGKHPVCCCEVFVSTNVRICFNLLFSINDSDQQPPALAFQEHKYNGKEKKPYPGYRQDTVDALILFRYTVSVFLQCFAVQLLGNIAFQPCADLISVSLDPCDVVVHCLQRLLPWHLPSTGIRCFTEEMLHLQVQQWEKC